MAPKLTSRLRGVLTATRGPVASPGSRGAGYDATDFAIVGLSVVGSCEAGGVTPLAAATPDIYARAGFRCWVGRKCYAG